MDKENKSEITEEAAFEIALRDHPQWHRAWEITRSMFSYTNHTLLPEALEVWPLDLLSTLLPRHLEIIYEINHRWIDWLRTTGIEESKIPHLSIIGEGEQRNVRMANLSVVGSHHVNGVSALHTDLVKQHLFSDFYSLTPKKFVNMTNGITPRRWLKKCNPELAALITSYIGDEWITDLDQLTKLIPLTEDSKFRTQWARIKKHNKERVADYLLEKQGVAVDPSSLFSLQIKRIHEYKRQILNVLWVITQYNRIKQNPNRPTPWVPRTAMIGGKAAPGYFMAKLLIKLVNAVGDKINNDPEIRGKLKLVFLENYRVSLAEKVIPAADLSEQISTAGFEASGTGNMKLSLNGALTIGTLDGANVEIREEVGEENIFIFGKTAEEILTLKENGYEPRSYWHTNPELENVLNMIHDGYFSPENPELFRPIVQSLLDGGDYYCVLADYADYVETQDQVAEEFLDEETWTRKSILNVANMGKFSSDRTIRDYAEQIWNIKPAR